MAAGAFVSVSGGSGLFTHRKTRAVASFRSNSFSVARRPFLLSTNNLYPHVDPPEPIENPLKQGNEESQSQDSPQQLFDKLNARQQNRELSGKSNAGRATDDPEDSSAESRFSRFPPEGEGEVVEKASPTLGGEMNSSDELPAPSDATDGQEASEAVVAASSNLGTSPSPQSAATRTFLSGTEEGIKAEKRSSVSSGIRGAMERFIISRRGKVDDISASASPLNNAAEDSAVIQPVDRAVLEREVDYTRASKALWRLGWVTWWIQLILTVISGVILAFSFAFPGVNVQSSASLIGFALSAAGVCVAFMSLFWTYSYTRLSIWLTQGSNRTAKRVKSRIAGKLRVGLLLSLTGMAISLLGLQAIVGTLLARLLSSGIASTPYAAYRTMPPPGGVPPGTGLVQPVDILVVQASANAMMGLMAALITTVWLRARSKVWQNS